jgi:hypothetical protein
VEEVCVEDSEEVEASVEDVVVVVTHHNLTQDKSKNECNE